MSKVPPPRRALVTGASRGIGRAIALRLGAAGVEVLAASRAPEGCGETVEEIRAAGGKARALGLDVSRPEEVRGTLSALEKELKPSGGIPYLVNNAGVTRDGLLMRMKDEDWETVLATNLRGAFLTSRALAPGMIRARHGRIVNITSVVAQMGNAGQANYVAAKAGLEGLTRSMARELAPRGVTVNAVAPGYIETDMTRDLPEEARARLLEMIPAGRMGAPADVAGVVEFLLSDAAAYITGAVIPVNGGMDM